MRPIVPILLFLTAVPAQALAAPAPPSAEPAATIMPGPGGALAAPAFMAPRSAAVDTPFIDDVELGGRLVVHGITAPLRWSAEQWLTIPAAGAVIGLVTLFDDDVARLAESNQGSFGDALFGAVEPFGQEFSIPLVVGMYGVGWALGDAAVQRTAVEAAAASIVAAGIVTPSLKVLTGRTRPRADRGQHEWDPLSGGRSFPSGHTTQAFAIASVIALESESWVVDALAWSIAAGVGGARVYHDAHWLSDVLAAAAIGTVVGHTMVRQGRELAGHAEPFVGGGGVTLGLRIPLR